MATQSIEEYLKLPYTIEVIYEQGENYSGWFGRVMEWPGCMTQADTFAELGEMIQDAMRAWAETVLEEGQEIPEPRPMEVYSGKFIVRLPKSLHRELVEAADRNGVSLNSFANVALGKAVGAITQQLPTSQQPVESLPIFNWPRLSEQARRVLILHGFSEEAQSVDERLFASWIEDNLSQIKASIDLGMYRDASRYIQSIQQALDSLCGHSPLITTYCQVVNLLVDQINQNCQLRDGIVERSLVESRIQSQATLFVQKSVHDTASVREISRIQDFQSDITEEEKKLFSYTALGK